MSEERIHGPYKHRNRWRVIEVAADGQRAVVSFESEARALRYIEQARKVASGRTVGGAVTEYLDHLRDGERGRVLRESTLRLERWRLTAILRLGEADRPLFTLSPAAARRLFEQRAGEVRVDTLAGELAAVQRATRWWVGRGLVAADPWEGLVVRGERSAGKPQLRVDEARKFLSFALREDSAAGTAAALALLTGMRASEVTGLTAHDVDDGGRLVWIARAKTKRGVRRLEVPSVLVPRLVALTEGREADAPLWGDVDRHWLSYHVLRIAAAAGLPRVTPHGLRGTWATLAVGALPTEHVAATLGHLPEVSRANYIAPGAEQSADAVRVTTLLRGTGAEVELPAGHLDPATTN